MGERIVPLSIRPFRARAGNRRPRIIAFAGRILPALLLAWNLGAFERARPGYDYQFPRDYFEHPEFQSEWWYYTGNLATTEGRRFGFELTFFRAGLDSRRKGAGTWDFDQVYLAHFVVADIEAGRTLKTERINRAGPGIAGASHDKRTIWNGNWNVSFLPDDPLRPAQRMWAGVEGVSVSLSLAPSKPVVVHGVDGISRKARGPGRASHYLSFTRLLASGVVEIDGSEHEVTGLAWMDHEFFTNSLSSDQVGWDWMSVQLDDGTDLMLYGIRETGGLRSAFSSGTLVEPDGQASHLEAEDFRMLPGRTWRSEETGAAYPVEWAVEVPRLGLRLEVRPLLDAQEIFSERGFTPTYWEGPVTYSGERDGQAVTGRGYLEMTGYDKPFTLGGQTGGPGE